MSTRMFTSADHINLHRREPVLAEKVQYVYRYAYGSPMMLVVLTNGKRLDLPHAEWLSDVCIARIALEAS